MCSKRQNDRPPTVSPRVRDATYDYEESLLRQLSKFEPAMSQGMVMVPDQFWNQLKKFAWQTAQEKWASEKTLAQKTERLRCFKELLYLERRIAELRSHRTELISELALAEKKTADAYRINKRGHEALNMMDPLVDTTRELFSQIFEEKIAVDALKKGLRVIKKYGLVTALQKENVSRNLDGAEIFQEGKVIYRTTRKMGNRFCLITIYTHNRATVDSGRRRTLRTATSFSSRLFCEEDALAMDGFQGMSSLLMQALLTEELQVGGGSRNTFPVYFIVVCDVMSNTYYVIEHQPNDQSAEFRSRADEGVIAHVNAYLSLIEKKDGTLEAVMSGTREPLRRIWTGKRTIEGDRTDEFHISIFELTMKTWLIRVYDHSLCKLYSKVKSMSERDEGIEMSTRVKSTLDRLMLADGVLRLNRGKTPVPLSRHVKLNLKALHTIRAGTENLWPSELVVNVTRRFGTDSNIFLVRASASPTQDKLGIIISDPIGKTVLEQIFCFSTICTQQAEYELWAKDTKNLNISLSKMAEVAKEMAQVFAHIDTHHLIAPPESQRATVCESPDVAGLDSDPRGSRNMSVHFDHPSDSPDEAVQTADPRDSPDEADQTTDPRDSPDEADHIVDPRDSPDEADNIAYSHNILEEADQFADPRDSPDEADQFAEPHGSPDVEPPMTIHISMPDADAHGAKSPWQSAMQQSHLLTPKPVGKIDSTLAHDPSPAKASLQDLTRAKLGWAVTSRMLMMVNMRNKAFGVRGLAYTRAITHVLNGMQLVDGEHIVFQKVPSAPTTKRSSDPVRTMMDLSREVSDEVAKKQARVSDDGKTLARQGSSSIRLSKMALSAHAAIQEKSEKRKSKMPRNAAARSSRRMSTQHQRRKSKRMSAALGTDDKDEKSEVMRRPKPPPSDIDTEFTG